LALGQELGLAGGTSERRRKEARDSMKSQPGSRKPSEQKKQEKLTNLIPSSGGSEKESTGLLRREQSSTEFWQGKEVNTSTVRGEGSISEKKSKVPAKLWVPKERKFKKNP